MLTTSQYGTRDFLSPNTGDLLDETVVEVFGTMLGLEIVPFELASAASPDEVPTRTGLVGFAAPRMRGSCEIRLDSVASGQVACAMMGDPELEMDEGTLNDTVGELTNVITAGWKNRIPTLSSECGLSIPSVISGVNYQIQMRTLGVRLSKAYSFSDHIVHVALYCEDVKPR